MKNPFKQIWLSKTFDAVLSEQTKESSERVVVIIAVVSFVMHLALIILANQAWLPEPLNQKIAGDPIASIYTPFSFILIYEVYLLVYYIPKSFTIYVSKQYEIITLIVIRRLFKDLSNLELTSNWFEDKADLQFTYDIITTIVLFGLIFLFYRLNQQRLASQNTTDEGISTRVERFIRIKSLIAMCLVPLLFLIASISLMGWLQVSLNPDLSQEVSKIEDVNNIFFDEFFTVLILIDVFLLLFSFTLTHQFSQVIRNSGFIISTILIRLSFSVDGLLNSLLIVVAVSFGVIILAIHNQYAKISTPKEP